MTEHLLTSKPSAYNRYDACGEPIVECTPKPKHEHAVFEAIAEFEALAGALRFDDAQEAQEYAVSQAQNIAKALKKAKLLDKTIVATGPDISLPMMGVDVENERVVFEQQEEGEDELDLFYETPKAHGVLKNVSANVTPDALYADGRPRNWQVGFVYTIAVHNDIQPYGMVELYARAPVATSELEYTADRNRRMTREALDTLLTIDDIEVAAMIDELNTILARTTYAAHDIARLGTLIKSIHAHPALTDRQSDTLVDMVNYALDDDKVHYVDVHDTYSLDQMGHADVVEGYGGVVSYTGQLEHIVIMPGFSQGESGVVRTDEHEAFWVADFVDRTCYMPLSGVQEYQIVK